MPRGELDRHFADYSEGITVLVPSYAEEPQVVRATLWSAALQEFPDLKVVLLLDDPPHPTDPGDLARLDKTRALTAEIAAALSAPADRFNAALAEFRRRRKDAGAARTAAPSWRCSIAEYEAAADWLETMAAAEQVEDHVDEFFVDLVLMGLARELRLVLLGLNAAARAAGLAAAVPARGAVPPADLDLQRED